MVLTFSKQKWQTEHLALVKMYMVNNILLLQQITPISLFDALLSYKLIAQLCCLQEFAHW